MCPDLWSMCKDCDGICIPVANLLVVYDVWTLEGRTGAGTGRGPVEGEGKGGDEERKEKRVGEGEREAKGNGERKGVRRKSEI